MYLIYNRIEQHSLILIVRSGNNILKQMLQVLTRTHPVQYVNKQLAPYILPLKCYTKQKSENTIRRGYKLYKFVATQMPSMFCILIFAKMSGNRSSVMKCVGMYRSPPVYNNLQPYFTMVDSRECRYINYYDIGEYISITSIMQHIISFLSALFADI